MTRASVLAVSCGDPSGIGPDIILSALASADSDLPRFAVFGDPAQLTARARALGHDVPVRTVSTAREALGVAAGTLPVLPLSASFSEQPGQPTPTHAAGIIEAIERAVQGTVAGDFRAVVTAPIAKKPLYEAGFAYPGHTEFLGALAEQIDPNRATPVMMIAGPELRTVPVTIHIPLADVVGQLTREAIETTLAIVDADMKMRFGLRAPRIAVAGLNPHAGEGGALGKEDELIINPALAASRARGLDVTGPLPADTMFHAGARTRYDVAVCMYHDQALIPAKTLAFDDGVNITLGLPFIRTSPDHGTAFDIAGTGKARPDSFIAALQAAATMAQAQDSRDASAA